MGGRGRGMSCESWGNLNKQSKSSVSTQHSSPYSLMGIGYFNQTLHGVIGLGRYTPVTPEGAASCHKHHSTDSGFLYTISVKEYRKVP